MLVIGMMKNDKKYLSIILKELKKNYGYITGEQKRRDNN